MFRIERRPLFYAGAFLFAAILAARGLGWLSPEREASALGLARAPVRAYAAGRVGIDLETMPSPFGGDPLAAFTLDAKRIWQPGNPEGREVKGRVRVQATGAEGYKPGDTVAVEGEIRALRSRRFPGGYDERAYLWPKGISGAMRVKRSPKLIADARSFSLPRLAASFRARLSSVLEGRFSPERAAFLKALLLGEKEGAYSVLKRDFIRTGTLHILAVSGFNVGFVIAAVLALARVARASRDTRLWLALVAVWAYCLLVGWQAPVLRASVMASVMLLGRLSGRRPDGLNSLGLAAIVVLAAQPRQAFDVGFQLSFLAVAALLVFRAPWKPLSHKAGMLEKSRHWLKELAWVSFVAWSATLPLTVGYFHALSPWAVAANLFVVPSAFVLFLGGAFCLAVPAAASVVNPLIGGFLAAVEFLARAPGSYLAVGEPPVWLMSALLGGLAVLLAGKLVPRAAWRALAVFAFLAALFGAQEVARRQDRTFRATFLDVGQGDAALLRFADGKTLLIDAGRGGLTPGAPSPLAPFFRARAVRTIDAAVISHAQEDHAGGLTGLFDEVRIRHLHYPAGSSGPLFRRLIARAKAAGVELHEMRAGESIPGFPASILALGPSDASGESVNDRSLVLRVESEGLSLLFTGDIGESGAAALLGAGAGKALDVDVLKVPHHGAKPGPSVEALFDAASPGQAIISCGAGNRFGHPRPETLSALRAAGTRQLWRTDEGGSYEIRSKKGRFGAGPLYIRKDV